MILDYARLERVTIGEKPYRKTTNRYPLENRKYSYKHFLEEQLDGEKVYVIVYGVKWAQTEVTEEEYKEIITVNKHAYRDAGKGNSKGMYYKYAGKDNSKGMYYRYDKVPNKIGIVRPDNTFEFITEDKKGLGQGVRQRFCSGWLNYGSSMYGRSKNGGVMVAIRPVESAHYDYRLWPTHPVFKGLRVNLDTGEAHDSSKYVVHRKVTIRKKVNEMCKPYTAALKAATLMLTSMTKEAVVDFIREEVISKGIYTFEVPPDELQKAKDSIIDTPIDSLLFLMYEWSTSYGFRHMVSGGTNTSTSTSWAYDNFDVGKELTKTIKKFKRNLCWDNAGTVLTEEEHQAGVRYPSSEWGVSVRVNNVLVEQYQ